MKIFWMLKNLSAMLVDLRITFSMYIRTNKLFFVFQKSVIIGWRAEEAGRLRLHLVNNPMCFFVIKGIVVPIFDFVQINFHVPVYHVCMY